MVALIEQLLAKLGLHDENNVLQKTTELLRLIELRSTNMPLQINEYGKIVLCADLAATLLNVAIDKENAIKLSGLRKPQYLNHKRMFEKLLDLNKIVDIKAICIKMGLNEVYAKATELLNLYKKVVVDEQNVDIDIEHPQYAAMAVFYACKVTNRKIPKTKFMPFSNLRPTQWQQLEQHWQKFISKHYSDSMENKLKKQISDNVDESKIDVKNHEKKIGSSSKPSSNAVEDYEKWKRRMLLMAEKKLQEDQQRETQMEKENLII